MINKYKYNNRITKIKLKNYNKYIIINNKKIQKKYKKFNKISYNQCNKSKNNLKIHKILTMNRQKKSIKCNKK